MASSALSTARAAVTSRSPIASSACARPSARPCAYASARAASSCMAKSSCAAICALACEGAVDSDGSTSSTNTPPNVSPCTPISSSAHEGAAGFGIGMERGRSLGTAVGRPTTVALPGRSTRAPPGLEEKVIFPRAQHDLTGFLELANRGDDVGLRRLDVSHARRAHELHLIGERLHRALRHRAHDLGLELDARRLERERELLRVDVAQQALKRAAVERLNV